MNFIPLMGKFEGGISLIPCSFFYYCPGFQIGVCDGALHPSPYSTRAIGDTLSHEGGHFVPTISSSLFNAANVTPRWQEMVSNKYFGLYLSIDTKHNLF